MASFERDNDNVYHDVYSHPEDNGEFSGCDAPAEDYAEEIAGDVPITAPNNNEWEPGRNLPRSRYDSKHIYVSERAATPPVQLNRIVSEVQFLGEAVAKDAVVVSSAAAYLALPDAMRLPRGLGLAVSETAYRYIREQSGWAEVMTPDGEPLLAQESGSLEVGISDYEGVSARAWTTPKGIRVASLADVYATMQQFDGPEDRADTAAIREQLLGPTSTPLPLQMMEYELGIARDCLPEHMRDDPAFQPAIQLVANGLFRVNTLYGDPRIGRANQIIGDLEKPEYRTVATYHNGFDVERDLRAIQEHNDNIGAPDVDRALTAVAEAYSDVVYGGGRKRDNPNGYDELRSAELLASHARQLGFSPKEANRLRIITLGTAFDEITRAQSGRSHADPAVRTVTGADLQILSEPDALPGSFDLAVEDHTSARYSSDRVLGRALEARGVRVTATAQAMEFIDQYPEDRPLPNGPTVKEALASRLYGNAQFHDPGTGYTPPDGWTLENPEMRVSNAQELRRLADGLQDGSLTAVEAYQQAQAYHMRNRHGE